MPKVDTSNIPTYVGVRQSKDETYMNTWANPNEEHVGSSCYVWNESEYSHEFLEVVLIDFLNWVSFINVCIFQTWICTYMLTRKHWRSHTTLKLHMLLVHLVCHKGERKIEKKENREGGRWPRSWRRQRVALESRLPKRRDSGASVGCLGCPNKKPQWCTYLSFVTIMTLRWFSHKQRSSGRAPIDGELCMRKELPGSRRGTGLWAVIWEQDKGVNLSCVQGLGEWDWETQEIMMMLSTSMASQVSRFHEYQANDDEFLVNYFKVSYPPQSTSFFSLHSLTYLSLWQVNKTTTNKHW